MVKRLDQNDRDILQFRPNIEFVEPDAQPGTIEGEDVLPLEEILQERANLKKFAKAVNVMAAAVQARADERAKTLVIKLDPNVDIDAVQAMRRKFPDQDPTEIPYATYRSVRNDIRNKGIEIGRQAIIQPEEVRLARDELDSFIPGDFGTELANTGGLRPELDERAQVLSPINHTELQINLICMFVNFIWKTFIKKVFDAAKIPVANVSIGDLLPNKLCNPGSEISVPGLAIVDQDESPLLSSDDDEEEEDPFAGISI
jgi:hypothetical protein